MWQIRESPQSELRRLTFLKTAGRTEHSRAGFYHQNMRGAACATGQTSDTGRHDRLRARLGARVQATTQTAGAVRTARAARDA